MLAVLIFFLLGFSNAQNNCSTNDTPPNEPIVVYPGSATISSLVFAVKVPADSGVVIGPNTSSFGADLLLVGCQITSTNDVYFLFTFNATPHSGDVFDISFENFTVNETTDQSVIITFEAPTTTTTRAPTTTAKPTPTPTPTPAASGRCGVPSTVKLPPNRVLFPEQCPPVTPAPAPPPNHGHGWNPAPHSYAVKTPTTTTAKPKSASVGSPSGGSPAKILLPGVHVPVPVPVAHSPPTTTRSQSVASNIKAATVTTKKPILTTTAVPKNKLFP